MQFGNNFSWEIPGMEMPYEVERTATSDWRLKYPKSPWMVEALHGEFVRPPSHPFL